MPSTLLLVVHSLHPSTELGFPRHRKHISRCALRCLPVTARFAARLLILSLALGALVCRSGCREAARPPARPNCRWAAARKSRQPSLL